MPYSFTQVEKDKSNRIALVCLFLMLFYTIVSLAFYALFKFYFSLKQAHYYGHLYQSYPISIGLSWEEVVVTLLVAFVVAALHFLISTHNIIEKVTGALQAQPINPKDTYHARFKNVLDEVMVAVGGIKIDGVVVPSSALNAFSIADFEGGAVIGVTEGLLSRLNRAQLEAVVAHEAAHIVSGDSLETTVTTSLFELYGDLLSTIQDNVRVTARLGELTVFIFLGYVFLKVTLFVSNLFKMFISREREFRADAVAVRLTRDPLSLAQALYLIASRWRGSGLPGDGLESIFIVNPQFNELDENQGLFPDLFSTHPPIQKRLDVLLDMAHATMSQLQEDAGQKQEKQAAPEYSPSQASPLNIPAVNATQNVSTQQWEVYDNGQWRGPFIAGQLMGQGWIQIDSYIRKLGDNKILRLCDAPDIKQFNNKGVNSVSGGILCPVCHINLNEDLYKGSPLLRCLNCAGILLNESDVHKLLLRDDYYFSDQIKSIGDSLVQKQNLDQIKQLDLKTMNLLYCPRCADQKSQMLRAFYTIAYPIEVDRCNACQSIWFDRNELEILQYLVGKAQEKTGTQED